MKYNDIIDEGVNIKVYQTVVDILLIKFIYLIFEYVKSILFIAFVNI